jgi:SAM-dependent methyltransferase
MREDSEQRTLAAITATVDLRGHRVLEIGCGDGRVTAMLAGIPATMTGIEPDAGCLRRAGKRVPGADFVAGSGQALPFFSNAFDTVIFTLSLHHQDSGNALAEAGRVLEEDGCIVAIEPEPDGDIERLCCLVEDESRELADAAAAMAGPPFRITCNETFSTRWVFDDRADLVDWLFSYYHHPRDPAVVREVDRFLGNRIYHRPLALRDDLRIVRLEKQGYDRGRGTRKRQRTNRDNRDESAHRRTV